MGASGKWFRNLIGVKKTSRSSSSNSLIDDHKKGTEKPSKRWGIWKQHDEKSCKVNEVLHDEVINRVIKDTRYHHSEYYASTEMTTSKLEAVNEGDTKQQALAVAAVAAEAAVAAANAAAEVARLTGASVRNHNYWTVKEEWAAIRVQSAFRSFLSRRALRALKGLVRLQALVRGHLVRKQAALTLRCMQALVRVQARVRARQVRMSEQGLQVQRRIEQRRRLEAQRHQAELGWCGCHGTKEEIEAKFQQKQEAAIKRERAMAYAFSHQWRPQSSSGMYISPEPEKNHWGWSWLERWMAAKPWENRTVSDHQFNNDALSVKSSGDSQHRSTPVNSGPPRSTTHKPTMHHRAYPSQDSFKFSSVYSDRHSEGGSPRSRGTPPSCSRGTSTATPRSVLHTQRALSTKAGQNQSSPYTPGYMSQTVSAKAKTRSVSTPRQRPGSEHAGEERKSRFTMPTPPRYGMSKLENGILGNGRDGNGILGYVENGKEWGLGLVENGKGQTRKKMLPPVSRMEAGCEQLRKAFR